MAIDNKDKKVLKSSIEREQNEVACSAECEKIKGSKNLNVPPLRFPEFSGEWKCTTIGNIGDIKNGPFGSVLHAEDYVENGIPIVTTEHFKTGLMPSDKFGIPQVSNEDYIRLKGYRLETNDIVFSRVGSVDINAHVGIEQNGWLFSGRVLRVRPKYDIDSLFLHYALSTEAVKRDIRNRAVGQTMPSINTPILSSTTIQLPKDLFEQKKVAHFLRLLDERIITQNKIIDKLKSLIKGIDEVVFQSCSKHCKLKEFDNQITAGRDKVEEGCFPLYGSTGVIGTTATPSYHEPLVLVARVGSIGCVQFVNIPCGVSDNTIVIRCGSKAKYVYYYLQNYNFERITSGTTQPLITAKDVKHIDIPIIDSANDLKAINTLDTLNMKLELESNLYNTILKQKAFLLQQMFI